MLDVTPLVRLYAHLDRRRLAAAPPALAQEAELLRLLRAATATRFGREHDFARMRGVADFQARVPLRRYEAFWEDYWKDAFPVVEDRTWPGRVPYWALTSGTSTGITKYIPFTRAMMRANARAGFRTILFHLLNRPQSLLFGGKILLLGGSTDLTREAPGVYSGDLSGIAARETPFWGKPFAFPPLDVALIQDWEEKVARIADLALHADIRAISGTPSWLLIFFDTLAQLRPDLPPRLRSYFPNLEVLVHGGVDFKPYKKRFTELLEGGHAELREVYPASEAFVAVADRGPDEGLRLLIDSGVFYEFVPVEELDALNPTRHWLGTIEPGIDYAVVVTSCAGVWAYVLGDTVRFLETDPPRLLITGRTSYMLSAFGEHLIDAEIEEAVALAAETIDASVTDYSVAADVPETPGALGRHVFIVEFAGGPPHADRIARFADALDRRLAELNADYEAHRSGGYGMDAPHILAAASGTFRAWMKARGRLGGQNKVPRIVTKPDLFEDLRAFAETRLTESAG